MNDLTGPISPLLYARKTVPTHDLSYWYFLGGITLFLFGIQVCTGILLLLYYRPSATEAFESVQYIMTRVQFGWLVRSIHSWAANLMIFTAFCHMFSVLFLGAYRKPRELTWITGMLLLFLAMGFGFSGYLLPWNTLAFFATKVGTEITGQVPIHRPRPEGFLRGGEDVTGATLTRFFGFHVALLPGLTTLLLLTHIALVQYFGMSVPPGVEARWKAAPSEARQIKFFPNFFLRELMAWYIALGVLGALGAILPWELGAKADPFAPCAGRHPAGMVFHVHVPDAQENSRKGVVCRRRRPGHFGVWRGRNCLAALAVLRSSWNQARTKTRSRRRNICSELYHRDDNLWIHG